MNDLASPAPNVSDEKMDTVKAPEVGVAFCDDAISSESVVVEKAPEVAAAKAGGENYETSSEQQPPKEEYSKNEKGVKIDACFQKGESHPLSVKALRGFTGADFEAIGCVVAGPTERTWVQKWFKFIFEERNFLSFGEAQRLVLVKGGCCFILMDEVSVAPHYAIPLEKLVATLEDRKKPHPKTITISPEGKNNLSSETLQTVLLRVDDSRKVEYQLTFDIKADATVANRFVESVSNKDTVPEAEKAILMAHVESFQKSSEKNSKSKM